MRNITRGKELHERATGGRIARADWAGNTGASRGRAHRSLAACRTIAALTLALLVAGMGARMALGRQAARRDTGLAQASKTAPLWGETVVGMALKTDSNLTLAPFQSHISQKTGEPLDAAKVAASLKNLYETGSFVTLRAEAKQTLGGVDLIFVGKTQFFVGVVRVRETSKGVPEAGLAGSTGLRLGQPLRAGDAERAEVSLHSVLESNSYYRARIRYVIARDLENQLANIVFTVSPGAPARLASVTFSQTGVFSAARLESVAGWKRGRVLNPAKLQRGLFEIHRLFGRRGYLEATVNAGRREYVPAKNAERLAVRISPGPLVRVSVEGAAISPGQMQKALTPIFQEGLTDDLSLDQGARDLESFFARRGYFEASAKWRRIRHPHEVSITYAVAKGPQAVFTGFDFRGNHSFPDATLAPLVTIQPPGTLGHTHGVFSRQMLNSDVKSLEAFYHSKGFLNASVDPKLNRGQGTLAVTFVLSEGPMTRVGKVTFEGVSDKTALDVRSGLSALPGKAYSPQILSADRDAILTYFAGRGYPDAAVVAHVSTLGAHAVAIRYDITPGVRDVVDRVVIVGNQYTRTGVIRRRVTLRAGDPLSQTQVYESQRRLYDLGLFNGVEITPVDPGGGGARKTVLVRVNEANRWTLGYGFGLDVQRLGGNQPSGQLRASPRLSLEATRINVGGRDQTFSIQGRVSDLETGAESSYLFSNFLNHPRLSLHVDLLADQTRDVLTFTSRLEQASLTLEDQLSPATFLLGRYNYRLVSVSSLRIDPEEIPLVSQPVRDAGFESTFIHDTRDNPADATRGSYSLLDGSISSAQLGSEASFVRFLGQNSTYHRFSSHLVFARNTQFGVESAYGRARAVSVPGGTLFTTQIPLAERFFAGGGDSLRAFSLNQAGPRDPVTGFPVGGDALFVNSLELRMPFHSGRYGVVLFNDSGNVYSQIEEMRLLKFVQSSPSDLNYTVDALGVGFRYQTPIGPIRFDVAYGPNTPRYEIAPAGRPADVLRLPRFQYFVSIGQSF